MLASPIAYLLMTRWVDGFAYRAGIWTFVVAVAAGLAIAWLTVSYKSIKAAVSDPVKALNDE